ncbi:acyl-CoA dehydrogenase family protein [Conexibacter sp. DBS9H8]|uniref:acyl-CoA dehydrogenase family protein n=1 Tax=Conexibacter sp. DBS9H8 TaxID=2937801 RepID=UPI00200E3737|nr:acyl-CoA dehydrogenase family protein [Conexibacter sp. DBS9H8]
MSTAVLDSRERAVLIESARDFARKEVAPQVGTYDREERLPADLIRATAGPGWLGAAVPEQYGGSGLDWVSFASLIEELSRVCHIIGLAVSMPSGLVGGGILRYGSEAQKQTYIRPLVAGETFAGAGVTEPGSGTAVADMTTTCRHIDGGYVIRGAKAWISMLEHAAWFLTFARLEGTTGRQGVCAFVVEADSDGLGRVPYKNKLGFRPLSTGDLVLDDVFVPAANRVGEEGQGYAVAMAAVETGRLSVAARALGLAQASLDASVKYATERTVMGQQIGRYQLVQGKITEMVTGVESARHLIADLAADKDAGIERPRRRASLAKMHASNVAMAAATSAVQIHGAYGISEDYPVARYFRDAKVFQIVEGNNELHTAMIAEYALGYREQDR